MTWVLITNEEAEAMIACEHPTLDESVSLEVEYGSQSIQIFDLTCPDCGFIHSTMYSDVTLEDSKAHWRNYVRDMHSQGKIMKEIKYDQQCNVR